jgi:hypothetical protein
MTRCACLGCTLRAALVLLRTGRPGMAAVLVEQALEQVEQLEAKRASPSARARKARAKS